MLAVGTFLDFLQEMVTSDLFVCERQQEGVPASQADLLYVEPLDCRLFDGLMSRLKKTLGAEQEGFAPYKQIIASLGMYL